MIVTGITRTGWSAPITLAANEVWQCKTGSVAITTGAASASANDGIQLEEGGALNISSGKTVRVRQIGGLPATLVRESFA